MSTDLFGVVLGPHVVPELVGGAVLQAGAAGVDHGHGVVAARVVPLAAGAAQLRVLHQDDGEVGRALDPLPGALNGGGRKLNLKEVGYPI